MRLRIELGLNWMVRDYAGIKVKDGICDYSKNDI